MSVTAPSVAEELSREQTFLSVSAPAWAVPIERLLPTHRAVLDYWQERRGNAVAPRRSAFHPFDIPRTLTSLAVWDIETDGEYRCRLAGTEVETALGGKLTGIALSDLRCTLLDEARREFDAVRDRGLVSIAERTMGWAGKPHRYYRHLLLPLTNDRGGIHMVLSVLTFHSIVERFERAAGIS